VLLRLLSLARAAIELAEAEVEVGGEGHMPRSEASVSASQKPRADSWMSRTSELDASSASNHGPVLRIPFSAIVREVERPPGDGDRVLVPASAAVRRAG
jgi:hypothetical protein